MSVLVRVSACLFVGVATSHGGAALADEPAVDPLSRVVVTATLSAEERLASPAFTTVITAEDIARSPANSIPDLLRDAAGINNQTSANGRDEIQVRGMDGRYTLILVDGKRVSSSGALWRATDFDLSTVPLSGIARIEIVRGPMSALYGSDAIGGVVNIITRKPGKQWEGSVGADYRIVTSGESGAQRRLQASARGALGDRVSLSIAGEAYDRKAWFQRSAADPREVPALEAKRSGSALAMLAVQVDPRQRVDLDLGGQRRPASVCAGQLRRLSRDPRRSVLLFGPAGLPPEPGADASRGLGLGQRPSCRSSASRPASKIIRRVTTTRSNATTAKPIRRRAPTA